MADDEGDAQGRAAAAVADAAVDVVELIARPERMRTTGPSGETVLALRVRQRAADVSAVLSRQTPQARQMLRKLLDGKIAVEPVTVDGRRGFRLSGRLNAGRLLQADVLRAIEATTSDEANSPTVVAPTGFEPVFPHRRALLPANQGLAAC